MELPDGTQAYTRDGALQRNQNGQLTTVSGYVIQPPMNVPDNALSISIGNDGIVTVTQPGAAGINADRPAADRHLHQPDRPAERRRKPVPGNRRLRPGQPAAAGRGRRRLDPAQVRETSNVNVAEELVNMITTQRAYEMNSKAVKTSDEMLARLTQL